MGLEASCPSGWVTLSLRAYRRWNDVPRGTMDEVSSHVRLDLPFV
jgi:hypothetical protein